MDNLIAKCVKMAGIFAKINDRCMLRKILTDDEYLLFIDMYNVFSAFENSQTKVKEKKENVCDYRY